MHIYNMQAYDQHLNMILGDVEEVVTTQEIEEETGEEMIRASAAAPTARFQFVSFSARATRFLRNDTPKRNISLAYCHTADLEAQHRDALRSGRRLDSGLAAVAHDIAPHDIYSARRPRSPKK